MSTASWIVVAITLSVIIAFVVFDKLRKKRQPQIVYQISFAELAQAIWLEPPKTDHPPQTSSTPELPETPPPQPTEPAQQPEPAIPPPEIPPVPVVQTETPTDDSHAAMIHAMHSNPLIPWFQPDSYLQELKRFINNSNGVNWVSISMHGSVYFKELALWNCAAKVAHDDHHIRQQQENNDKTLKKQITDAIVSALLRADHIAHQYQPDRKYHIITGSGKRNNERLVPVKLKSFGMDTVQAELLKNAFLQDVTDIQKGHFYGHNP